MYLYVSHVRPLFSLRLPMHLACIRISSNYEDMDYIDIILCLIECSPMTCTCSLDSFTSRLARKKVILPLHLIGMVI